MFGSITRIASTASIALLTAAIVVPSFAQSSAEAPVINTAEFEVEGAETAVFSDYPEDLQFIARASVAAFASMPREYRMAKSKDAEDLKGYEKSLYRGKYYHKDQERFRQCVMKRESHHNYRAANRSSSARGAYQFLDNNWRDGLVHMMLKESKKKDDQLHKDLPELFDKPIHKWNRYYQDRAFFTALNYNGKWSGKKHWNATVPGTGC